MKSQNYKIFKNKVNNFRFINNYINFLIYYLLLSNPKANLNLNRFILSFNKNNIQFFK